MLVSEIIPFMMPASKFQYRMLFYQHAGGSFSRPRHQNGFATSTNPLVFICTPKSQ
jgi:hypothetical protein